VPPGRIEVSLTIAMRRIHIELPPILLTTIALGLGLGSLERRSNLRLAKQSQQEVGTSASVLRAALGPFQLHPRPLVTLVPNQAEARYCVLTGRPLAFDDVHCRRQRYQRGVLPRCFVY